MVCVFDVNETLLDLAGLDPLFLDLFDDAAVRPAWFAQLLQLALVSTVTGDYRDFGSLGGSALAMTAERRGAQLPDDARRALGEAMRRLQPHPEVAEALGRLREAGARTAALTNSTLEVAEAQLGNSGLRGLFDDVLSADEARRLKPAPEPYRMAAERLGVEPGRMWLIAAHFWDVAGAMAAGCRGAFVARPQMVLDPLAARQPEVVGRDLADVAGRLLEARG